MEERPRFSEECSAIGVETLKHTLSKTQYCTYICLVVLLTNYLKVLLSCIFTVITQKVAFQWEHEMKSGHFLGVKSCTWAPCKVGRSSGRGGGGLYGSLYVSHVHLPHAWQLRHLSLSIHGHILRTRNLSFYHHSVGININYGWQPEQWLLWDRLGRSTIPGEHSCGSNIRSSWS